MDFNACDQDYLEKTFDLEPVFGPSALGEWLSAGLPLTEQERYEADNFWGMLVLNVGH